MTTGNPGQKPLQTSAVNTFDWSVNIHVYLRVSVKDVGGDVDGALVGVDGDPGEVLVRLHVQPVEANLEVN